MPRLHDRIALVTGAARGIGEAIARAFVAEGAFAWITDIDETGGRSVAAALGERAAFLRLDVREEGDWRAAMATVLDRHGRLDVLVNNAGDAGVVDQHVLDRHGRLDVLVNNAGITGFEAGLVDHDPEHASLADWHAVHRTNLDGVFLGCKHGIAAMRATGAGSIINLSSRSGLVGIPGAAAYASSKAAVRNHSKTVALYCAEQGLAIRCNSLHPAAILTPMWEPVLGRGPDREARMRAFTSDCPMRRFGRPDEVAAVAVLLASDEAAYLNGAELTIDGGILAGSAATPDPAQG